MKKIGGRTAPWNIVRPTLRLSGVVGRCSSRRTVGEELACRWLDLFQYLFFTHPPPPRRDFYFSSLVLLFFFSLFLSVRRIRFAASSFLPFIVGKLIGDVTQVTRMDRRIMLGAFCNFKLSARIARVTLFFLRDDLVTFRAQFPSDFSLVRSTNERKRNSGIARSAKTRVRERKCFFFYFFISRSFTFCRLTRMFRGSSLGNSWGEM